LLCIFIEFTSYIFVGIPELNYISIDIIRTTTVTNIQSTCQFILPSATITSQSVNITLSMINQSVNVTVNETNNSATVKTAIIVASVAGGLLTLCIISICILVIIIKRDKTRKIRHGLFSIVSM